MAILIPNDRFTLFWAMQCANVLSLPLLRPPFLRFLVGLDVYMTTKYDYLYSIKQFVPDLILDIGFRDALPLHAVIINSTPIFFPGVGIECILGTLQGVVLGFDLLHIPPGGALQVPVLPAAALFLYAGM